ncbi:MAG TPA: hypothetical protein VF054_20255 [Micromonosporaceae bacterium]
MREVVLLSLGDGAEAGCGCGDGGACAPPRVPVLACRDALAAEGVTVETVTANSDADIDAVVARLDGPARADELTWPGGSECPALVVAAASDGEIRAVLRRMVRRYAPPPSRRPADLDRTRTVPDLPPIGVLPLTPGVPPLVRLLGLPVEPVEVAKAVLGGHSRRVDLLRNDGGSVTLHGVLLGGVSDDGAPVPWHGVVEVDDTVLSDGREPLLACAVSNGNGYARLDDIPMTPAADPTDGTLDVAVLLAKPRNGLLRRKPPLIEVRRYTGRAVAVTPRAETRYADDGVAAELGRKRSWWMERGAWAVFTS